MFNAGASLQSYIKAEAMLEHFSMALFCLLSYTTQDPPTLGWHHPADAHVNTNKPSSHFKETK